jgi:hypothetical protein
MIREDVQRTRRLAYGSTSRFLALLCFFCATLIAGGGGCNPDQPTPTPKPTGDDDSGGEDIPTDVPPPPLTDCEKRLGDACGSACTKDEECGLGLHCASGACDAECFETADCPGGDCSKTGLCTIDDNIVLDPRMTDPTPDEDTKPPKCIEGQVQFGAVLPQVWLLLDRSGSMADYLGTVTRWEALGAVLLGDPSDSTDKGVVGKFEDRVAFGATFYTSGAGAAGCALSLESVALATHSYGAIRQRYRKISPSGGTPTADSVAAVIANADSTDVTGGPKILVLATDGAPGPCAERLGEATTEVEAEVELGHQKGIQTFAISISSGTDLVHMQRVANLGVGLEAAADPPAPLFTAESQEELATAFEKILGDLPKSCVFSLNGRVKEENADQGTVQLAGEGLDYQGTNGWALKAPDQVELVGKACDQIRAGEEDLDISFPCAVFEPIFE